MDKKQLEALRDRCIDRPQIVEEGYRVLEKEVPPVEHSEAMRQEMNRRLGFPTTGPRSKGADYRPYCVWEHCEHVPRMVKIEEGFLCWSCDSIWNLRLGGKVEKAASSGEKPASEEGDKFVIQFMGSPGQKATQPPNPRYPEGVDVKFYARNRSRCCTVSLPYPAKGVGTWRVKCTECGARVGCTAVGRPDDPRSIEVLCKK